MAPGGRPEGPPAGAAFPGSVVTNTATKGLSGAAAELTLKATPPRTPRDLVVRQRLASGDAQFRDRPLVRAAAVLRHQRDRRSQHGP